MSQRRKLIVLVAALYGFCLIIAPMAAEAMDRAYFCVFGAWIPVYTYSHAMA